MRRQGMALLTVAGFLPSYCRQVTPLFQISEIRVHDDGFGHQSRTLARTLQCTSFDVRLPPDMMPEDEQIAMRKSHAWRDDLS
jgi:hypothetical protein